MIIHVIQNLPSCLWSYLLSKSMLDMVLPSHTTLGQDYIRSLPQSSRMEPGQSWRDGPHQNDLASTLLPFLFLVFHSSEYSTKGEEGTSIIYKPCSKHLPNYKTYWLNWSPLYISSEFSSDSCNSSSSQHDWSLLLTNPSGTLVLWGDEKMVTDAGHKY